MAEIERPVGWHADLEANRYRYWDGERWTFSTSRGDLDAYRKAGQTMSGVDFAAPLHSELPPEPRSRTPMRPVVAGVGALLLVVLVVAVLVTR
jgi:hypothetical protein